MRRSEMKSKRSLTSTLRKSNYRDTIYTKQGGEPVRVNFENVVKEGILKRRGYFFGMYLTNYMFYLEKGEDSGYDSPREENSSKKKGLIDGIICPPLLKYGKNGQAVYGCLDLGQVIHTQFGKIIQFQV